MRTKILAAAVLATSALAAPAFAQSAADNGFTGPRAEAVVGWDRVEDSAGNGKSDGVVYGGAIGYDHQVGNTVIGVEGEITGSTNSDRANSLIVPGDYFRAKAGRDLYVGGRVGFLANDKTMIYAKAGYTNAQFRTRYQAGDVVTLDNFNADGWRLGAGAEVKLSGQTYAKAEYRYSNYNDSGVGVDAKRHQVLAGVGVRF